MLKTLNISLLLGKITEYNVYLLLMHFIEHYTESEKHDAGLDLEWL